MKKRARQNGTEEPAGSDVEAALTERQRRFVEAYRGPGSGAQAAAAAGYGGGSETLRAAAYRLARHPRVRAALEARGLTVEVGPGGRIRSRQATALDESPGTELDGVDPGAELEGEALAAAEGTPLRVWVEIMRDSSALPSARNQAAAFVYRAQQQAKASTVDADPLGTLRERVRQILVKKAGR